MTSLPAFSSRPLLFLGLLMLLATVPTQAQDRETIPVRFVEMIGPETTHAGEVANFRARVNNYASRPLRILWDFGDGTRSVGNLIAHRYDTPGTYTVRVYGRNAVSADTARLEVVVLPARPGSTDAVPASTTPVAAVSDANPTRSASSNSPRRTTAQAPFPRRLDRTTIFGSSVTSREGGYTWVVRSDLWRKRADDASLQYRVAGYRASVLTDTSGTGSPVYRVVIGQFQSTDDAVAVRDWLPEDAPGAWLLDLDDDALR